MVANKIIPSRTALLLLDFQVALAQMHPRIEAVIEHSVSIIKLARSKGITIAHCRVCFTDAEAASVPDSNPTFSQLKTDPGRAAMFHADAAASAFHPAVTPQEGDIVLRKNRVGPFFNAPQDTQAIFKERGIDTLLIGGVATGGAVASTVVQGADLDYRMFVVEDACADPSQETHDFLIKFFEKRATVIKSSDIGGLIE